jgi:hypothetical protein
MLRATRGVKMIFIVTVLFMKITLQFLIPGGNCAVVLPPVRCQDSTAAHTQNYHYIDREDNFSLFAGSRGCRMGRQYPSRNRGDVAAPGGSGSTAICCRNQADACPSSSDGCSRPGSYQIPSG